MVLHVLRVTGERALLAGLLALVAGLSTTWAQPALTDRTLEVSGTTLHLRCGGERPAGAPLVVLEAGAFNDADTWRPVQQPIARFARACAHDRPGRGESGPAPDGLDARGYVTLLRDLLRAAGEPPPYVFVGHSMGGLIATLYATMYGSDLGALVLIDSSHEEQMHRMAGIPRPAAPPGMKMPAPEAVELSSFAAELRRRPWRGDIPLVVISRGVAGRPDDPHADARYRIWMELQRDLVSRSPDAMHIMAPESGHNIQSDQPELIVEAVRGVLGSR